MQAPHSTTPVLVRQPVIGSAIVSPLNATPRVAGVVVTAFPDRTNGYTPPRVHQQTVTEAKEMWRYEGSPN